MTKDELKLLVDEISKEVINKNKEKIKKKTEEIKANNELDNNEKAVQVMVASMNNLFHSNNDILVETISRVLDIK